MEKDISRNKDNRSLNKRHKMKDLKSKRQLRSKGTPADNEQTSSSSAPQQPTARGVCIDVADSSDDRYAERWTNRRSVPLQQRQLDMPDDSIENELDDLVNAQLIAADFAEVAQLPTSVGMPFQLSGEKNWQTEEGEQLLDQTEAGTYFTLNLKLLNVGLQSIPFYKRMDYPSSMFEREQIAAMEKCADAAEKSYQKLLQEYEAKSRNKTNKRGGSGGSAKLKDLAQTAKADDKNADVPDELDELLEMTSSVKLTKVGLNVADIVMAAAATNVEPIVLPVDVAASGKDDVQQWLDNVLEE